MLYSTVFLVFQFLQAHIVRLQPFFNFVSDLKCSQHGFIKRQIRLSIELPFLETLFVDTGSLKPIMYIHVEVELRIFLFFLHLYKYYYMSPSPIVIQLSQQL